MELEPKKISELTEEQRLASLVALRGYKSYVGLGIINLSINQGELSDIFENTIGVITASYQSAKVKIISDGLFTPSKTVVMISSKTLATFGYIIIGSDRIDISIPHIGLSPGESRGEFVIEIRVYN